MPAKRLRRFAVATLILVPLLASGFIFQDRAQDGQLLFGQIVRLITTRYVDTVEQAGLYERAARGLLEELNDPYTELYTPKDLEAFTRNTGGRYGGLGMQIGQPTKDGPVVVSRVFPHTPAETAGILEGDRIIGVDTINVRARGWSTDSVSAALLGTPDTKVRATFERPGVTQPIVVNFTRAVIKIPAVPYAIVIDGVGYVPMQQFNEFSAEEMTEALNKFTAQKVRGVVFDLRDNPGGLFDQSLEVSNLFLGVGQEITSVRGRTSNERRVATDKPLAPSIPLVVLTDGNSASASEIVAGALQDHDRALVLGTTSYGKGLVQSVFNLDGGYAVKMTTAKWYTPSGRSIQKERKMVKGEYVEVLPDSLESDSVKKSRPAFKSDAGRTVYGGGGITPDVIVRPDTITTPEQNFLMAIAPKSPEFFVALSDYALELKKTVKPNFTVTQVWRDEFFRRINAAGVKVERPLYNSATATVDRLLLNRVARLAFGDSTAKRMALKDDVQLVRALDLFKTAKTQQDLFTAAHVAIGRP